MRTNRGRSPLEISAIRAGLESALDPLLVKELFEAYTESKRNYYLGNLRPTEVEGGRFCEAAFRMLQQRTKGTFAPVAQRLDTEKEILRLANIPAAANESDSVRLHIPRALRVVYDIRNNRDAAHLADGIDPNLQDATLVISVLDWVLAEFVRFYHNVSADEAQRIIEELVTRQAPVVQDFQGFLKVLNPRLSAGDHLLVLLYQRGGQGATYDELEEWSRPSMRDNLRRTLGNLTHDHAYVHFDGERHYITRTGMHEVEDRKLYRIVNGIQRDARRRTRSRRT